MFMQIGNPPKQPDIILATAKTFVSVVISPNEPSFLYLFPLLSNSYKYKNCSKMITIAIIIDEGMISINSAKVGSFIFLLSIT